ncbi:MAG: glutamine-hydrolyzing GMP synthase [Desulfurococcaceae archaeon]
MNWFDSKYAESYSGDKVIVVNFGSQYTHLIARRVRDLNVFSLIVDYEDFSREIVDKINPCAIILSGGPSSVFDENAPSVGKWLFELDTPVLGICYGHQLIAHLLGGVVREGFGEYGPVDIRIVNENDLFKNWGLQGTVWMSHRDYVVEAPGIEILAVSENNYIASFRVRDRKIYGVQFHPEVKHTWKGDLIISNFLFNIANCRKTWFIENIVSDIIDYIRKQINPGEKVLVATSGGVDSTVTAVLIHKAIGDNIIPVFVNHGLLRKNEVDEVLNNLLGIGLKPLYIDASERFLSKLENTVECEERRKIIGEEFGRIFKEIIDENPSIKWIAQGTIYPDFIESGGLKHSSRIKSHHNVAGFPQELGLKVIEPIKWFYKDEVRRIGKILGLPNSLINRQPFPGPGLGVRIIGKFTREKLEILREATEIVENILKKHGLLNNIWQAFPVIGDDKWIGIKGDKRFEGYIITIRIVESEDAMTADYSRIPYSILDEITREITSRLPVTVVTYAVTPKPPSTIEPC